MKRFITIIICISLMSVFFSSCKNGNVINNTNADIVNDENTNKPYTIGFNAFDTTCILSIYGVNNDEVCSYLCNDLKNCIDKYNNIFSKTSTKSDIYKINHRTSDSVMVTPLTATVFDIAKDFYKWSYGKFDISAGTLIELWDVKNRKTLPSEEEIKEAMSHCGNFDYVIERDVDSNSFYSDRITFYGDKKTKYDCGALVKGYVCDDIRNMFETNEVIKAAILNLGGNVYAFGTLDNRTDKAFNIGVIKPFTKSNEILDKVKIRDRCAITSGIYERYFKIDGDNKTYHHIIDPTTGYPTDNKLYSATIISKNGLLGDYLSTTCMLLGEKDSKELIDFASKNFEDDTLQVIFVNDKNKVKKYPKNVKAY